MTITSVFFFALAWLLVSQLLILPALRKKIHGELGAEVIKPYALFHLFAILRTVALAALLGAAVVIALTWNYGEGSHATAAEAMALLDRMRGMRDAAVVADTGFTAFVLFALTAGLGWLTYKQAKQKAEGLFTSIREEEYDRVVEAYQHDEWETLPPTDLMRRIADVFANNQVLLAAAEATGDAAKIAQLQEEQDILHGHYLRADASRRMNLQVSTPLDADLVLPESSSWPDRLHHMVMNRGVFKTLKGGSKVLAFVALVALLPASLGINLQAAADSLNSRYVQLDTLRIKLAGAEAERRLADSMPPALPPVPSLNDDAAEDQIVNTYDESFNSQIVTRAISVPTRAHLARAAARESILRDFSSTAPHLEVVAGPGENADDILAETRKKVRERVHLIRENNKAGWEALKAAFPSSGDFATPVARSDLKRALVGEVAKSAFATAGDELAAAYSGHANEIISSVVKGASADAATKASFERREAFWTTQADSNLHTIQQHVDPEGNPVDRAMRENPPTLRAQAPPAQTIADAEQVLRAMPSGERRTAALFAYQDLLPGRLGDELHTPAAGLANRLTPRNTPHIPAAPSPVAFKRAFSYHSLRGFSRVGGVLIGRTPENERAAADITDFAWSYSNASDLTMTLTTSKGVKHRFGPYPAGLVWQALGYAADQRPLAVTMITGDPIPDLKIIAHPSLIDTSVGCRAVQLDRLADSASGHSSYRPRAQQIVEANDALYRLAWAITADAVLPKQNDLSGAEETYLRMLAPRMIEQARQLLSGFALDAPNALGGADDSPTRIKTTFYNADLVKLADGCVKANKSLGAVEQCIRRAPNHGYKLKDMLSKLPEFQIWSGVRELPYQTDANLNYLRPAADNALWPFDFVLQTAFTRQGLTGPDEVVDETPWEFPAVHERLVDDVRKLVATDDKSAALIAEMRAFAVIQRLFRAAFAGQLGEHFPLDKLMQLSRELKKRVIPSAGYKTPRWNPSWKHDRSMANSINAMSRQPTNNAGLARLVQELPEQIWACAVKAFGLPAANARKVANIGGQDCSFKEAGQIALAIEEDTSATDGDRANARTIRTLTGTLALRRTLSVFAPENFNTKNCPAL